MHTHIRDSSHIHIFDSHIQTLGLLSHSHIRFTQTHIRFSDSHNRLSHSHNRDTSHIHIFGSHIHKFGSHIHIFSSHIHIFGSHTRFSLCRRSYVSLTSPLPSTLTSSYINRSLCVTFSVVPLTAH